MSAPSPVPERRMTAPEITYATMKDGAAGAAKSKAKAKA